MKNVFRVVKGVLSLAALAFVVAIFWGVFTALDAAPLASVHAYGTGESDTFEGDAQSEGAAVWGSSEAEDVSAMRSSEDGDTNNDSSLSTASSNSDAESTSPSSTNKPAGSPMPEAGAGNSAADSNSPAPSGSANASDTPNAPTPSAPQKVWVPAWDEYVACGHWEAVSVPASFGERAVYGSVCSECGANISGFATAHLRDTHHSGYHEGIVGCETYEITPARTEQVWVDTSHWITHPGYWQ